MIEAVLFDLDGTLIDTAPDMAAALNRILIEEKKPTIALDIIRPHVSKGGLALVQLGFSEFVTEAEIEPLRQRFLKSYLAHIAEQSKLFDGFSDTLKQLETNNIIWGIVTNKPHFLTIPLLQQLGLEQRCATIISGDTTAQRKPHPLPLQTAAKEIGIACENCLYIGDDPRDIDAGNAANMDTMIACYGYIFEQNDFTSWQADYQIQQPTDLLAHLNIETFA